MIVHDFDILGVPHHPPKTDPPLVVNSYTHLACSGAVFEAKFMLNHGRFTRGAIEQRKQVQALIGQSRKLLQDIE